MNKAKTVLSLLEVSKKHLSNWLEVFFASLLNRDVTAKFRLGGEYSGNARKILMQLRRYENRASLPISPASQIAIRGDLVVMDWLGFPLRVPVDMFFEKQAYPDREIVEDYDVNVVGKTVLDIGAYIGDTALFFIWRGARRVVAVEPVPRHFDVLKMNSEGLPIECIHGAVGHPVPYLPHMAGSGSYGIKHWRQALEQIVDDEELKYVNYLRVPLFSLSDLVEKYRPQVVKIDAEGAEYFMYVDFLMLKKLGVECLVVEFHRFEDVFGMFVEADDYEPYMAKLKAELGGPVSERRKTESKCIVTWAFTN